MYDFAPHLKEGEKILWQGKANPKKGGKLIFELLFVIFFILVVFMPISVLLRFNTIIPIMVIFIGAAGYGLFYFVFIKDKKLPMIFTVSPISAP